MDHKRRFHPSGAFVLSLALVAFAGCNKSSAPPPQAAQPVSSTPAPPSDAQITAQVQNSVQADQGLSGAAIQAQANNGVVTLSGTVPDDAARELAGNDAAQVAGVRTVINNLTVQSAKAAAPVPAAASAADRERAAEEARLRRQKEEQARKLRQQELAKQKQAAAAKAAAEQAQNTPPPPPPQPTQPVTPPPPPPPPQPVTQTVTVPAGTDLAVRTTENLETGKTQTNDSFHGVLAENLVIDGLTVFRKGMNVSGIVLDSKDATHFKGQSELSLGLQQIQLRNRTLQIATNPVVRQGAARGKNTALKAGGGALLGTLIGALAGGGKGALIGAAAGAGAGTGANAITRGQQVQIPSESVLHFTLSQPVSVTVTTMPGSSSNAASRWNAQGNSGSPYMQPPPNSQSPNN